MEPAVGFGVWNVGRRWAAMPSSAFSRSPARQSSCAAAAVGFGRTVALRCPAPTSYHMCLEIRYLYSETTSRPNPLAGGPLRLAGCLCVAAWFAVVDPWDAIAPWCAQGLVALPRCTTAHPRYTIFTNIATLLVHNVQFTVKSPSVLLARNLASLHSDKVVIPGAKSA
jgi:hypothetical protein